jgi:hypothetical protein
VNVPLDTPELDQGEMAENPMPAPKASSTNVRAAAAIPPAAIAAQDYGFQFAMDRAWQYSGALDVSTTRMLRTKFQRSLLQRLGVQDLIC